MSISGNLNRLSKGVASRAIVLVHTQNYQILQFYKSDRYFRSKGGPHTHITNVVFTIDCTIFLIFI